MLVQVKHPTTTCSNGMALFIQLASSLQPSIRGLVFFTSHTALLHRCGVQGIYTTQFQIKNQVFAFSIPLLFFLEARHFRPSITQFATMFFFTPRNPYRVHVLHDDFFKLRTKFRLYSSIRVLFCFSLPQLFEMLKEVNFGLPHPPPYFGAHVSLFKVAPIYDPI